ncbi:MULTISPECIES: hypothetical protein [unclassified Streptomyces]|uniref:hypothetical protein n=1 Tax=unclassified Streptomyces TaxID=2593676 RepID=UPI0036E4E4A4
MNSADNGRAPMEVNGAVHEDDVAERDCVALLDDQEPFDWQDLRTSGERATKLLEQLAGDARQLGRLLKRVGEDETLLSMCESHQPFDKIVLYNGDERNFRIRLHIWRTTEFERAHQHRFSFTAHMVQGQYRHVLYDGPGAAGVANRPKDARRRMDPDHADHAADPDLARIRPVLEYEMKAGDSYTLHHDAVHATLVSAQTVSLILRGPAEKDVAFVANLDEGGVYWRFGRRDESEERIRAKQLTRDTLHRIIADLTGRGITA